MTFRKIPIAIAIASLLTMATTHAAPASKSVKLPSKSEHKTHLLTIKSTGDYLMSSGWSIHPFANLSIGASLISMNKPNVGNIPATLRNTEDNMTSYPMAVGFGVYLPMSFLYKGAELKTSVNYGINSITPGYRFGNGTNTSTQNIKTQLKSISWLNNFYVYHANDIAFSIDFGVGTVTKKTDSFMLGNTDGSTSDTPYVYSANNQSSTFFSYGLGAHYKIANAIRVGLSLNRTDYGKLTSGSGTTDINNTRTGLSPVIFNNNLVINAVNVSVNYVF